MGWLPALFGLLLPASAAHAAPAANDGVTVSCSDFVRVTDSVFTGRTGAWFEAHGERDYLGGATFGPGALFIRGVDPAAYLARRCTSPSSGNATARFAAQRGPGMQAARPGRR